MSIFISGGCKNGKSTLAERIASASAGPRYYVATMIPHDGEDEARIRRHRLARRELGFTTIECGRSILDALQSADTAGAFLIDSVTALLANEMFTEGGAFVPNAADMVARDLLAFIAKAPDTVLVSDDIFQDAGLYDEWTERYRAGLGMIGCSLAKACDRVIEVVAGQAIIYKGDVPWNC
ncbi:MAG: adenosylcobinamide kinase/adenosylcobinamide-phosphate guanylyltransferase [Clostridiales bacterium]|nr:adenosylcobinamide kinase/adenosylcobinamide-phosphate guanylyltransferase [Clostridiales bacterium]